MNLILILLLLASDPLMRYFPGYEPMPGTHSVQKHDPIFHA